MIIVILNADPYACFYLCANFNRLGFYVKTSNLESMCGCLKKARYNGCLVFSTDVK